MVTTTQARLFRRGLVLYGCLRSANRNIVLARMSHPSDSKGAFGQRNVRLVGAYAAFEDFYEGQGALEYRVRVVSLRTGRAVTNAQTGKPPPNAYNGEAFPIGIGPTESIVLRANGAVAWIARNRYSDTPTFEVRKADGSGHLLLDAGENIHPMSLTRAGKEVTWVAGGQTKRTSLK